MCHSALPSCVSSRLSTIARIIEYIRFVAVHQRVGLRHVVDVSCGADHRVNQSRVGIHADVDLHAEVPHVPLLRLMHLRVVLALFDSVCAQLVAAAIRLF